MRDTRQGEVSCFGQNKISGRWGLFDHCKNKRGNYPVSPGYIYIYLVYLKYFSAYIYIYIYIYFVYEVCTPIVGNDVVRRVYPFTFLSSGLGGGV